MVELRYSHRLRLVVSLALAVGMGALCLAFVVDPAMSTAVRVAFAVLGMACLGRVVVAVLSHRRRAVLLDPVRRRIGTRWFWRREPYWCDLDSVEIATEATQRASTRVGGPGIPFRHLVLWNTDARSPGPTWGARSEIATHQRRALEDLAPWVPGLVPFMVELNGLTGDQVARLQAAVPPGAWVRVESS